MVNAFEHLQPMKRITYISALLLIIIAGTALLYLGCARSEIQSSVINQPRIIASPSPNRISEITSEVQGPGVMFLPTHYKIVLQQNGAASFTGEEGGSVQDKDKYKKGKYKRFVGKEEFDGLAALFETHGFFNLQSEYTKYVSDGGTVITSAVRDGKRKSVSNFADAATDAKTELRQIEEAISDLANRIKWEIQK